MAERRCMASRVKSRDSQFSRKKNRRESSSIVEKSEYYAERAPSKRG